MESTEINGFATSYSSYSVVDDDDDDGDVTTKMLELFYLKLPPIEYQQQYVIKCSSAAIFGTGAATMDNREFFNVSALQAIELASNIFTFLVHHLGVVCSYHNIPMTEVTYSIIKANYSLFFQFAATFSDHSKWILSDPASRRFYKDYGKLHLIQQVDDVKNETEITTPSNEQYLKSLKIIASSIFEIENIDIFANGGYLKLISRIELLVSGYITEYTGGKVIHKISDNSPLLTNVLQVLSNQMVEIFLNIHTPVYFFFFIKPNLIIKYKPHRLTTKSMVLLAPELNISGVDDNVFRRLFGHKRCGPARS